MLSQRGCSFKGKKVKKFFRFLFDIAKPPVHHASGAFYFFTFLPFYL